MLARPFAARSRADIEEGVPGRRWTVGPRSWVSARMVPGPRGQTLVRNLGVVSFGVVVATLLFVVDWVHPEMADPEFSLGVGEVAAPTGAVGSGDPPRAELEAQVDEASLPPGARDGAGHGDEAGRGDASVASDSGSPTGSSGAGSDSSTVEGAGSGGSGRDPADRAREARVIRVPAARALGRLTARVADRAGRAPEAARSAVEAAPGPAAGAEEAAESTDGLPRYSSTG